MTEFGVKFERWGSAAQKAGIWFRWVKEGADAFMRKWQHNKSCRAAERHAKAAAAPPTVDTHMGRGEVGAEGSGGGRGGGWRGGE